MRSAHIETPDAVRQEIRRQILLVYSYSGMVALEKMNRLITTGTNLALTLSAVVDDAVRFKAKYDDAKDRAGEDWEFARIMLSQILTPLDAVNYPDLYTMACESAVTQDGFKKEQFITSTHKTRTPLDVLKARTAKSIEEEKSLLPRDIMDKLRQIGIDPFKFMPQSEQDRQERGDRRGRNDRRYWDSRRDRSRDRRPGRAAFRPPAPPVNQDPGNARLQGSNKRPKVMPDHYDGKTSWTEYLGHFEICTELNEWSNLQKAQYLCVSLRGAAAQVLRSMPREQLHVYRDVVKSTQQMI